MRQNTSSSLRRSTGTTARLIALVLALSLSLHGTGRAHGDLLESIAAVNAEIEKNPKQPDLYLRRGSLYRSHQDWVPALADFEQAQKLDPTLTVLDLARGELLTEMGKFPDAAKVLKQFCDARPEDFRGWTALGRLDAQQLKWSSAAAYFAKAVQFARTPDPELYLAQVQALRSAGMLQEASDALDAGVAKLGNLPVLIQPAIDIAVERKRWDEALTRIDAAVQTAVRKERWLLRKGEVLEHAARPADALAAYRQALTEYETLPPNRRAVAAMVAFEQGLRAAIARLEQAGVAKTEPAK